ncbi:sugar transferase [Robertmurraya sp. Marseille-Q9965]
MNSRKLTSQNYAVTSRNDDKVFIVIKRIMDVMGALIGILVLFLLILLFFVIYQLGENKGPMFYKQVRVGKNGKRFEVYKFRSMVIDAEEKLMKNKILYQKYLKNNYKLMQEEDPRLTMFGKFIRNTSLDEFPQFINVLKGEMSLVGPRPVVDIELQEYKERVHEFLSVKPGITGYWQSGGRSTIGYPERVDIELYYVFNRSLQLDIKILFNTFVQVINRKGAY